MKIKGRIHNQLAPSGYKWSDFEGEIEPDEPKSDMIPHEEMDRIERENPPLPKGELK